MADEPNERLASLEADMRYVMGVLSKREEYQMSVMKSLTAIEIKMDQSISYQKTCDAERDAQDKRTTSLENTRENELGYRKMLRTQAAFIGAFCSLIVATAALFIRH
jgi:hypothetical protein